jgi:hypothetical protein
LVRCLGLVVEGGQGEGRTGEKASEGEGQGEGEDEGQDEGEGQGQGEGLGTGGVRARVRARFGQGSSERGAAVGKVPEWMAEAACRGEDGARFFEDEAAAVEFCRGRCGVAIACGAYALQHRIGYGVWGGMDAATRRALAAELELSRPRAG